MNTDNKALTVEQAAQQFADKISSKYADNFTDGVKIGRSDGFEAGAAWREQQGGIQWVKITPTIELAKDEKSAHYNPVSIDVLLIDRYKNIVEGFYNFNQKVWYATMNEDAFKPTHYAFINYP